VVAKVEHVGLEWNLHPGRRSRDTCRTVVNPVSSAGIAGRAEVASFAPPEHHRAELPATGQPTRMPLRSIHVVVTGASGPCHTHELTNVRASGELDGIVVANRPLFRYAVAPAIPTRIGMTNATSRCP